MKTFMKIGCNAILNYCMLILMLLPAFSLTAQLNIVPQILPKTFSTNGLVNCIQKKGNTLFVGGEFDKVGFSVKGAAAFTIGDSLPMSDFPFFNGELTQAISDANGGWYVAGSFTEANGINIPGLAHINSDFTIDTALNLFANNPTPDVKALLLDAGVLYVGGYFTYNTGVTRNNLLAINTSTQLVTSWNPDPDNTITNLIAGTNSIFASGDFAQIGGANRNGVAEISKTTGLATVFDAAADGYISRMALSGNTLYIAGGFSMLGDSSRSLLGAVNILTGTATSFNPLLDNSVESMKLVATTLYIAGNFTEVNSTTRNYVAAVNANTGALLSFNPNPNNIVNSISVSGSTVYLTGGFDSINGIARDGLAATNSSSGALNAWNPKFDATPTQFFITSNAMVVSGSFNLVNPQSRKSLYAIDIATNKLLPFDAKLNNWGANLPIVNCMHIKNDSLFVGGTFDSVSHVFQQGIVAFNSMTGLQLAFNPYGSIPPSDYFSTDEIISSNSKLFIAGQIMFGGTLQYFFEIDLATGQLSAVNHIVPNGEVTDMIIDNNKLFIVGKFIEMNAEPRNGYAVFELSNYNLIERNVDTFFTLVPGQFVATGPTKIQIEGPYIYLMGNLFSYQKNQAVPPFVSLVCIDKYSYEPVASFRPLGSSLSLNTLFDMQASANYLVISGQLPAPDNNIVAIRISSNYSKSWIPNIDLIGAEIKFCWQDGLLAMAGNFEKVGSKPRKQLSALQIPNTNSSSFFQSISPSETANNGKSIVTINGAGFTNSTSFRFTKSSEADIVAVPDLVGSLNPNLMGGIFDFNGKKIGKWNVVITIPGDTTITIVDGFTIDSAQVADPFVIVNSPSVERINRGAIVEIIYGNNSNVPIRNYPLNVVFSDTSETIELLSSLDFSGYTRDSLKLLPDFFVLDTVAGVRNVSKVFPLLIRSMPAHSSGSVFLKAKGNGTNLTPSIEAYFTNPLYDEDWIVSPSRDVSDLGAMLECALSEGQAAVDKLAGILGYLPGVGTMAKNMSNFTKYTFNTVINAMHGESNQSNAINTVAHAVSDNINLNLGKTPPFSDVKDYAKSTAKDVVGDVTGVYFKRETNPYTASNPCQLAGKKTKSDKKIRNRFGSADPNNKTGPNTGGSNFVRSDIPFPYTIRFENLETATATAQDVLIVDTLDKANFDLSTFELGSIIIGNHFFTVPRGKKEYVADIDLRPEIPLIAEISAALNTTTGVVTWRFSSLDTLTGLPTTTVLDGFLPPNTLAVSPQGQGAVTYSVRLKAGVASQTAVNNKAYIYFDSNAPIITNNWQNKIDNNKPVSAVQPLNPSQPNNAINLVWSGSDSTSGIKHYDIFFRTTSGSYQLLLGNTSATSAVFRGEPDSTYFFYSIATDSAGNVENAPNTADAFTKLTTGIKFVASDIQFNVYPNPANSSGFVDYTLPEAAFVEVALFDVQGRKIVAVLNEKQESHFHQLQLNLQNVEAGMYLVKLTINGQTNIRQLNILH